MDNNSDGTLNMTGQHVRCPGVICIHANIRPGSKAYFGSVGQKRAIVRDNVLYASNSR